MHLIAEWAKERLMAVAIWLVEPTKVKSTVLGVSGFSMFKLWEATKPVLSGVALVCTAFIMLIHAVNIAVRQWCPLRRGKISVCDSCPLKGSIFCSRGTNTDGKADM